MVIPQLYLGDSVSRHLWETTCDVFQAKHIRIMPDSGSVEYGDIGMCVQSRLNLTIYQYHVYGEFRVYSSILHKKHPNSPMKRFHRIL